ncbi:hypothetical protein AAFC00_000149 [Neodothiora populina]|uniref:Nuclear pore complex protein An-Nup82 n=1 Tax=Neodothiora populina TaxID=2781224 RepID=A0ABR3P1J7_9PEZI
MPKVLSYTPSWLSRPSPGFSFFQPDAQTKTPVALNNGLGKKVEHHSQSRTIAHRGTEIFAVVGNEIRWSNLLMLRDGAKEQDAQPSTDGADAASFRRLKTPVSGQIRQLVVSPLGDFLAILTSHTVHVAVLPDSSHLSSPDTAPLRLKTFQLGPTAHVLEQSPVVSALWHPLAHLGACLVTVTADACVRVWELDRDARHSFDEPALALDLKKLGNASSADEDFRASKYGTSKAFSPDSVEMEVAAACFGGSGTSEEHGWSPMTLWLAMTEGDVYALCPLLPSKWEPTPTTIPSLSTSVVSKATMISHDPDASADDRRITEHQQKWLADIDSQDPLSSTHPDTFRQSDVYFRPTSPPAIPKLQGPFQLTPEPEFSEVSDIFVIAPRIDDDAMLGDEDEMDFFEPEGLSVAVICLATRDGNVHICLDLNGVEAQWLPSRRAKFQREDLEISYSDLVLVETVKSGASLPSQSSWPTFTKDPTNRYAFFMTLSHGLFSYSLNPWIANLEQELANPTDSGAAFRLDILLESERTAVDQILQLANSSDETVNFNACISLLDPDLGWVVLISTTRNQPYTVILDIPVDSDMYDIFAPDSAPLTLPAPEPRQHYQPDEAFFTPSTLPAFLDSVTQSANTRLKKSDLKAQVRFSPATLQLLTEAHRVLSTETNRLGAAAADLFRRCERMKLELTEQIRRVDEIAKRIESVTGDDDEGAEDEQNSGSSVGRVVGREKIERRMATATDRSQRLQDRVEALRRKMTNLGGKELTAREEAWAEEVLALKKSIGGIDKDEPTVEQADNSSEAKSLSSRLNTVAELQKDLLSKAKAVQDRQNGDAENSNNDGLDGARVPLDFRKQKIQQVMQLLQRETALVDAVTERLGRLGGIGS